jgi:MoaA/NifB/PqqE/SkfB family radical SAM enzyme
LSRKPEEEETARQEELSLDEISKVADSLGSLLWLAFSGGEIFLRQDLIAITKIFYKRNRPAIILLPSNGLLPDVIRERTEEILAECPKSSVVVKLSLDGSEEVHDRIRGVEGAYRKMRLAYDSLVPLLKRYPNFELGVNTVFCAANQDRMAEVIALANELPNNRTHTISLIRGEVSDDSYKAVDLELYNDAIERLAKGLKGKKSAIYGFRGGRLKAAQDILQRRIIYKTATQNRYQIPCFAGRLNLVLGETGDLYPCESFSMKLGNVRQHGYDLPALLARPESRAVIDRIRTSRCFCTHECYTMTNILFNPAMYPALLREFVQL